MPRRTHTATTRPRPRPVASIAGGPPPEPKAEAPKISNKAAVREFAALYRARCAEYEAQHGFSPMPEARTSIRNQLRAERPDLAFTVALH